MEILEELPNGGCVIARRLLSPKREGLVECEIVLCHLPHNPHHPWATWQRNTQECVGTYWGHYFDNLAEAERDYKKRGC